MCIAPSAPTFARRSVCSICALMLLAVVGSNTHLKGQATGPALRGVVQIAGQVVVQSSIQVYAAGTRSYGEVARPLLNVPILTDDVGSFTIPSDLHCPSAASEVYVVATGGHAVLEGTSDNSAISLMSALGPCDELGTFNKVTVNEVTTIASVYALNAFFASGTVSIGAPASNQTGLKNAFSTVKNLVDLHGGSALAITPAGNGSVPQTAINTLANIFATCADPSGLSGTCGKAFLAATPTGQPVAATILQAALQIALYPSHQVGTLYALASVSSGPYAPALTSPPNDWSLSVNYTGSSLTYPQRLAVDSNGDVWIPNALTGPDLPSVAKLSNAGVPLSGPLGYTGGGLYGPLAVAIDAEGSAWVANFLGNDVVKLSSSGNFLSGSGGFTTGVSNGPSYVAIDASDNAWVTNFNNFSVSKLDTLGNVLSGPSGYLSCTHPPCSSSFGALTLAFDTAGDAFIPGIDPDVLVKLSPTGSVLSGETGFTQGLSFPSYAAVDEHGVVWVTNTFGSGPANSVTRFDGNGNVLSNTSGGRIVNPNGIAIDGRGHGWVVGDSNAVLNELDSRGKILSGSTGYIDKTPLVSYDCPDPITHKHHTCYYSRTSKALAIDGSGDIWVSTNGNSSISEFIGLAYPVITPLTIAVRKNKLGHRP